MSRALIAFRQRFPPRSPAFRHPETQASIGCGMWALPVTAGATMGPLEKEGVPTMAGATTTIIRPDFHEYYMSIAFAVRGRANCKGWKVGAVLIVKNRIVSTGYNGVPEGMKNCLEGGCDRCARPEKYPSGVGYDLCICVHAEDSALLNAARLGIAVDEGVIYTTVKPCFSCMKALHQAGIKIVYYHKEWTHPDTTFTSQYRALESKFAKGVKQVEMTDPSDPAWVYPEKHATLEKSAV